MSPFNSFRFSIRRNGRLPEGRIGSSCPTKSDVLAVGNAPSLSALWNRDRSFTFLSSNAERIVMK